MVDLAGCGQLDCLVDVVEPLFSSAWIYLVSLVFCAVDGFLPLVPSETVVITSGVFAAAGKLSIVAVVLVATVGAFLGDCASYLIGRFVNARFGDRLWRSPRRRAAHNWASRALDRRGGMILIIARFVPGGRTATTVTAGAVGYSPGSFAGYAALAAITWGLYAAGLGYIGGIAFRDQPLLAVLLGLGVSLLVSFAVELVRRLLKRRAARKAPPDLMPTSVGSD